MCVVRALMFSLKKIKHLLTICARLKPVWILFAYFFNLLNVHADI